MLERPLLAPLDEGAYGCRRGVKNIDAVALDDLPEAIRLGMVRRSLVHERRRAVRERAVDDVGVARPPADVSRAPVQVFVLEIEDPFRRQVCLQEITAGRVKNAFGFSGRARRVEDKERVLAVEFFGGAIGVDRLDKLVPPVIASDLHIDARARAAHYYAARHGRRLLESLVDGGL